MSVDNKTVKQENLATTTKNREKQMVTTMGRKKTMNGEKIAVNKK